MTAHPSLPHPLTRWLLGRRRSSAQGFTLTELLVSLIIGTLIMGSLLYLVVELLGINTREERLTQVQQDTRRALDYMGREVREAVFVYADPTVVTAQLTDDTTLGTPVIAFWKLQDLESRLGALPANCNTGFTAQADKDLCNVLKIRRSAYHLVVYFVQGNAGTLWAGPSRIIRYELPAYANIATLQLTTGYRDPTLVGGSFPTWTRNGTTTAGNSAVLTDSIDNHDATATGVVCPRTGMTQVPAANGNNFFTCLNNNATGADDNKTLHLFLRGSIAPNNGDNSVTFGPVGEGSRLPTLRTDVQIRGVLERTGTN